MGISNGTLWTVIAGIGMFLLPPRPLSSLHRLPFTPPDPTTIYLPSPFPFPRPLSSSHPNPISPPSPSLLSFSANRLLRVTPPPSLDSRTDDTVGPTVLAIALCVLISLRSNRQHLARKAELGRELEQRQQRLRDRMAQLSANGVTRVETKSSDVPPSYGDSWEDAKLECAVEMPAPTYQPTSPVTYAAPVTRTATDVDEEDGAGRNATSPGAPISASTSSPASPRAA